MPRHDAALQSLIAGIIDFLGPPTGELQYIVFWSIDQFDVAIERHSGPHVWLSTRWRIDSNLLAPLTVEEYSVGQPRISNLNAKNTPTLTTRHSARRLSFVRSQTSKAVDVVRACAVEAGVMSTSHSPDPTADHQAARLSKGVQIQLRLPDDINSRMDRIKAFRLKRRMYPWNKTDQVIEALRAWCAKCEADIDT